MWGEVLVFPKFINNTFYVCSNCTDDKVQAYLTEYYECPVYRLALFTDSSFVTETVIGEDLYLDKQDDLDGAYIHTTAIIPKRHTYYLQGITEGNKTAELELDITICGAEQLSNTYYVPIIITMDYNVSDSNQGVEYDELEAIFRFTVGSNSHMECGNSTWMLCEDDECKIEWTRLEMAELVQNPFTREWRVRLHDNLRYSATSFFVQRKTLGLVTAV